MQDTSIAIVLAVNELNKENAAYGAVQNFIDIYENEVDRIAIIGPSTIEVDRSIVDPVPVSRPSSSHTLSTVIDYTRYQIRIARKLWRERNRSDLIFFHIGGSLLLLPMIICRLSQARSLVFITGSIEAGYLASNKYSPLSKILARVIRSVEGVTCALADDVILLSENMDPPAIPWPFSTSIRIGNFNYIDSNDFNKNTPIENRSIDIVFIGRFESVKGVENLVYALPNLIERDPDIQVKFIGSGKKENELKEFLNHQNINENIIFTGWINREEIPNHLNDAQTIVMPSVSEGVPKTILEAMSCGTVPIATPVGGIPDIIDNNQNGFLLQDSDPETIEQTISRVLDHNDLNIISDNAHQYIKNHYSYQAISRKYINILNEE